MWKTLYVTVAVTLDIFLFVYVHSRCIANKPKKTSNMSTLPSPGKISADAHGWRCIGCKRTAKSFDLAYSDKIPENSDTYFVTSFSRQIAPDEKLKTSFVVSASFSGLGAQNVSGRASLGKFGQNSFAPPKMCLLLHL